MKVVRRLDRGFARPEIMIYIALIGVGAALIVPTVQRHVKGEAVGTGGWILAGVGVGFFLGGLWPLGRWAIGTWFPPKDPD